MTNLGPDLLAHDEPVVHAPDATDRLRWVLLLCWVVLLGYCIGFSGRLAPLDHLESAVRSGEVRTVNVGPPGLPAGAHGYGTQQVTWRQGFFRHQAAVVMTTKHEAGSSSGDGYDSSSQDGATATRSGRDIVTELRREAPGLEVVRESQDPSYGQVYGWYVPSTLGLAALVLILLTLMMLISGPRPWWATRWAWFWLMATPVGTVLFLLLSGPTPGMPTPRSTRPRLRGGWALVLAAVSSGLLPTLWTG